MIQVLITLCVIGILVWLATTYIPMAEPFKRLFVGVAVIGTVLWLLSVFGLLAGIPVRLR